MPKIVSELGALEVKRLAQPGLHSVGGVTGLKLHIATTGARSWIFRATVGSRIRDIGLGGFPTITLGQARDLARDAHIMIRNGIDPVEDRRRLKAKLGKSDQL